MPTYEYECRKCQQRFEQFQSMTDKALTVCPTCGGPLRRLLGTGAAVIFRGSGFRRADYSESGTRCGQQQPCCGRDAPCETPPCGD
jgi:putative FmdB family regulatory protein